MSPLSNPEKYKWEFAIHPDSRPPVMPIVLKKENKMGQKQKRYFIFGEREGDIIKFFVSEEYTTPWHYKQYVIPEYEEYEEYLTWLSTSSYRKLTDQVNLKELKEFVWEYGQNETSVKFNIPPKVIVALGEKFNFPPYMNPELKKEKMRKRKKEKYDLLKAIEMNPMPRKLDMRKIELFLLRKDAESRGFKPSKPLNRRKHWSCGIPKNEWKRCREVKCPYHDRCEAFERSGEKPLYVQRFLERSFM